MSIQKRLTLPEIPAIPFFNIMKMENFFVLIPQSHMLRAKSALTQALLINAAMDRSKVR
jgi:hypothetical protein